MKKIVIIVIITVLLIASCKLFKKEEPKPIEVYGCMDSTATNYNPQATIDDGSCDYCSDSSYIILITNDSGVSWDERCINIPVGQIIDITIVDENNIWICTAPNIYINKAQILYTNNGGYTWVEQYENIETNDFFNYIEMFDDNNGIAMGDGKDYIPLILRTTDGGENWISTTTQQIGISGDLWRRVNFVDINIGFLFESGINPQKLYRTIDGGYIWQETNFSHYAMALKFYDENIGLVLDNPNIRRTLDGGSSWEEINMPYDFDWGQVIEFHPNDPSKVWAAFSDVYFSSDTGRTWTPQVGANIGVDPWTGPIRADDLYFGENIIWAFDPYFFNREGILFYNATTTNEWNVINVQIPENFGASGVIDGVGDQIIVIPGRIYNR